MNDDLDALKQRKYKLQRDHQDLIGHLNNQIQQLEARAQQRHINQVAADYRLSPEHIALLKRMEFVLYDYEDGGDLVSIGVSGKHPFGNSSMLRDIADILGWKLPNDDLSRDQEDRAMMLFEQLPFALNDLIAGLPLDVEP